MHSQKLARNAAIFLNKIAGRGIVPINKNPPCIFCSFGTFVRAWYVSWFIQQCSSISVNTFGFVASAIKTKPKHVCLPLHAQPKKRLSMYNLFFF